MLDSVTPESIFAEIMMDETPTDAYFLVEGPDESSVFFGHVSDGVMMIVCGGKKNVLGAVRLAEGDGLPNVYGLVDNDFDRAHGLDKNYPKHVVATSAYDLIADLILSSDDVLRRSLSAHAVGAVSSIEVVSGRPVDHSVFALTSRVAAMRLATIRNRYPFKFKGFDYFPVVSAAYEPVELVRFLDQAAQRVPRFAVDAAVHRAVEAAFFDVSDTRSTSGGHDIVGACVALLRKAGSQVSVKTISGTIISVASCHVLSSLSCLRALTSVAREDSGVELLDCLAA